MAKHHSPGFLALADDAKRRIQEISATEVKAKLESRARFHLVDVRAAEEWAAGHLPRAMHLCKEIIERDAETAIPDPNAEIILCCGGRYRSALATDNLQRMGYRRPRSLPGGWRGWIGAGLPVTRGG